ncbi:MAG: hypothetical protein ABIS21_08285 [Acidimicrobiales bacterium]
MRRAVLLVVLTLVVGGGACSDDGLKGGDARLSLSRNAHVKAARPGDNLKRLLGGRTLSSGSTVEVLSGSAFLELASGTKLELRRGSVVRLGDRPILESGDLLVLAAGERPLTVLAGGSQVRVSGAARLSRDLAVSAASYQGRLSLRSAGRSLEVPALRQGDIPSLGVVPERAEPLDYDPTDAWDRRFLGDAIELGEELEAKSEGFTSSLRPNEGRTPGYFRLLLPDLENEPSFGPPLLTVPRTPGETLVGATISVAAKQGSFVSRWRKVFAFRDEGAPWGLVALDQKVDDSGVLVRSLDAAIGRATLAFAPAAAPTVVPPSPAPLGVDSGSGTGEPQGGTGSGTGEPAAPPPSTPRRPSSTPSAPAIPPTTLPPAPTVPSPPDTPPLPALPLQPVVDTIAGLLNGL